MPAGYETKAWHVLADRAWAAFGELGQLVREHGGIDGYGLGWDFERNTHLLRAYGDGSSFDRFPEEIDGFRLKLQRSLYPRG